MFLIFECKGSGSCRGIGRPLPSGLFTVVRGGSAVLSSVSRFFLTMRGVWAGGGAGGCSSGFACCAKSLMDRIRIPWNPTTDGKAALLKLYSRSRATAAFQRDESNFDELHAAVTVLTETSNVDAFDDAARLNSEGAASLCLYVYLKDYACCVCFSC